MYVGIAFISVPKSVSQAGLIGSIVGFMYIVAINIWCIYILLKARNRFKREEVIDICDLSVKLYGEGTRPIMSILLIATNAFFLMAYVMFLGTQTDQLVCRTFRAEECGYGKLYAVYIFLGLLPIIMLRKLAYIGYFSIFVLVFTFISVILILYMSSMVLSKSPEENEQDYHLDIKEEDRNYVYWDTLMVPVFCAAMMSLFEGN